MFTLAAIAVDVHAPSRCRHPPHTLATFAVVDLGKETYETKERATDEKKGERRKKKMKSFLSIENFKGNPMVNDPHVSPLEALLEVARVASLKLHYPPQSPTPNPKRHTNHKSRSLKRSHATLHDEDEQEWVLELRHNKKKRSKNHHRHHSEGPTAHTTPKAKGLPEDLKKKIEEMGGSEVNLLIQKTLYYTDLSLQHNRLSLPMNQIRKLDFLRESESLLLNEKKKKGIKCEGLDVFLVDPCLRKRSIVLGKWKMNKSSCYMLRGSWIKVANENGLTVNDVVQVWSFRVQQQLCMALVKLT
ncbi:B3 domain-containing protein [Senna tora]|uniref:B3 domain-containing protein n=1 Tax=Senna tora TaxID=362788 RepID=A0A834WJ72_9FABA|nr:B3 domain-containing protein [Senna tora]